MKSDDDDWHRCDNGRTLAGTLAPRELNPTQPPQRAHRPSLPHIRRSGQPRSPHAEVTSTGLPKHTRIDDTLGFVLLTAEDAMCAAWHASSLPKRTTGATSWVAVGKHNNPIEIWNIFHALWTAGKYIGKKPGTMVSNNSSSIFKGSCTSKYAVLTVEKRGYYQQRKISPRTALPLREIGELGYLWRRSHRGRQPCSLLGSAVANLTNPKHYR